jgi:hypothetical protein
MRRRIRLKRILGVGIQWGSSCWIWRNKYLRCRVWTNGEGASSQCWSSIWTPDPQLLMGNFGSKVMRRWCGWDSIFCIFWDHVSYPYRVRSGGICHVHFLLSWEKNFQLVGNCRPIGVVSPSTNFGESQNIFFCVAGSRLASENNWISRILRDIH